eukprot:6208276-Karenia_brevis.AAC.1
MSPNVDLHVSYHCTAVSNLHRIQQGGLKAGFSVTGEKQGVYIEHQERRQNALQYLTHISPYET